MRNADRQNAYDSWDSFEATLKEHRTPGGNREDHRAYMPDPEEVKERASQVRWMRQLVDWPEKLLDSIMIHDCPVFSTVLQMVKAHGFDGARDRLCTFLEIKIGKKQNGSQSVPETEEEGGEPEDGEGTGSGCFDSVDDEFED